MDGGESSTRPRAGKAEDGVWVDDDDWLAGVGWWYWSTRLAAVARKAGSWGKSSANGSSEEGEEGIREWVGVASEGESKWCVHEYSGCGGLSVGTRLLFAAGWPESPSRSPLPRCPASSGLPHHFPSALPPSSLSSARRPVSSALGSCHSRPLRRPRSVPVSRQTTPSFSALALVCPLLPEPFQ